jgi:hypothetical protein
VPERVDEGSTVRLFEDRVTTAGDLGSPEVGDGADDHHVIEDAVRGRHFARRGERPSALRAATDEVVLDLTDAITPLVRYEWRSPAGETIVVEAAWPFARQPGDFDDASDARFHRAS